MENIDSFSSFFKNVFFFGGGGEEMALVLRRSWIVLHQHNLMLQ